MKGLAHRFLLVGFCLLVFGGKLSLIHYAGCDLPTWDQWDAEGEATLRPWLEGTFDTQHLFQPHNEHRLVTTKLWVLGLFQLNGQWDALVETTANALVHTACALVLLLLAARWLRGTWLVLFGVLLAALFTLPFSWENTLFGFQIQFYFVLLFSFGHIALTLRSDRFNLGWGTGQLCGALAVVTMASGFLSSLAVLTVLGYRLMREWRWTAQQIVSALFALSASVAGWLLKTEVLGHASLKAQNAVQLLEQFLELLAWPGTAAFPWALLLAAPTAIFIGHQIRRREITRDEAVFLGLTVWVLLQALAIAYARSGGGMALSSRYLDLLAVHVALGFIFLVRLWPRRTRIAAVALWLAGVGAGLAEQSHKHWHDAVVPNIARQERQQFNVRSFLATGDPSFILDQPWGDIPFPDGNALLHYLSAPVVQEIMPVSARRAVPIMTTDVATSELPRSLIPPPRAVAVSTWPLHANTHPFTWRSVPQAASTLPYLRFSVAGDLGGAGRQLHLTVHSAAGASEIVPDYAPGEHWKTVTIARPAGTWWVEAVDADPDGWFAFTAPVELSRLSWFTSKLLKHCAIVLLLGGVFLAVGVVLRFQRA